MIHLKQVIKQYENGEETLTVLDLDELAVDAGESVSLVGPSGSGKSTLLALIAGLDRPTSGAVRVDGRELSELDEDELARFRLQHIGFIFQAFQLLDNLTALENVALPAELCGERAALKRAKELLAEVGLSGRLNHFPSQLSGGEQQRVAIARAFINSPGIILADEPTGDLDGANGEKIQRLLVELNREHHTTLVVATHDLQFAELLSRRVYLKNGKIVQ
jgi:putative ABC transport system ATP-binding protein